MMMRVNAVSNGLICPRPARSADTVVKAHGQGPTLVQANSCPMILPATPRRKHRSLAIELVEQLTTEIREGRFEAGRKLPTEAAIVEVFGVSRTVVREAISRLQATGLVETRQGVGTFVLAHDDSMPFRIATEQLGTLHDVIELLEFRISVETEATALAAMRRSEDNLDEMRRAMHAFGEQIEARRDAVAADLQFHLEIARATQNHHFTDLMNSLGARVFPRGRLGNLLPTPPERLAYLRRVNQEHESIYNAIAAQDTSAARAAMHTHLSNSRDRLRRSETSTR